MKWYNKLLVIPALLSVLSNWWLFYYHADTNSPGGAEIRGDLWKSFLAQFTTIDVPFELFEQTYNWPLNTFQLLFAVCFVCACLTATKTGRAILGLLVIFAAASRQNTVVVYEQRRQEFWNPNTNSIDYH